MSIFRPLLITLTFGATALVHADCETDDSDRPWYSNGCALSDAAFINDLQTIRTIVNNLAPHHIKDAEGIEEALVAAAECGDLGLVRKIISLGVSCNVSTRFNTPLTAAAENGHITVIKELLAHGADINEANRSGNTALINASWSGHIDIVKLLLARGADLTIRDWHSGCNALIRASTRGHADIVKLLLEHGADCNATSFDGTTALMMASNIEVARILLAYGAHVNARDKGGLNYMGDTALTRAASFGRADIVEELIKHGADINMVIDYGYYTSTALTCAHNFKTNQVLLNHGANYDIQDAYNKSTPLMHATEQGYFDIVKLLVKHGANVNLRDKNGNTALSYALTNRFNRRSCPKIAKFLKAHGATE